MPTEEENIQYLYLVLTHAGPPTINWPPVSTALSLSPGATSKRWSRLRIALENGKPAGKGAYELLWLCVKHSSREKALDWKAIASACGTTPGAASKRYSRMKAAWDRADATAPPSSAAAPATPKKTAKADQDAATPTPKRKRAPAAKPEKAKRDGEDEARPESDDDDDADDASPSPMKRARAPTRKIKSEPDAGADADEDAALPTPVSSADQRLPRDQNRAQIRNQSKGQQHDTVFQGFPSAPHHTFEAQVGFKGFRDLGAGQGEGGAEEWHESSEYLDGDGVGAAGGTDRVSGWLDEI